MPPLQREMEFQAHLTYMFFFSCFCLAFGHCEIRFIPSLPSMFFSTPFPLPTTWSNHFYGELDWSQDLERAWTPSLSTTYAGFRLMEKTFGKKIQSRKGKIINGVTRVMLRDSQAWHFQIWMSYSCSASGPDNVKGFPVPSPLIKGLKLQPWSPIQEETGEMESNDWQFFLKAKERKRGAHLKEIRVPGIGNGK